MILKSENSTYRTKAETKEGMFGLRVYNWWSFRGKGAQGVAVEVHPFDLRDDFA